MRYIATRCSSEKVKREPLAKDIVILNHGQGTKTTPDLVTLLLTSTSRHCEEFGLLATVGLQWQQYWNQPLTKPITSSRQ
ncbi:hypothetical protein TNCV_28751 [Trichonephila clavipes]|uniref:Uncharacterized protein n=1 Tax=Trichonephila clavipes TaxID=2585209 RepID=A0A8X6WMZ8_TRICX|nr:hypothetical protein TNCV_28751 [Trichonephila clavipes]